MYLDAFQLREQPFGVTPDPRFFYQSRTHREAMASLYYGVQSERGFIALIAPPGMGKTMLLFQLLQKLGSNARTAFLFQTQCDSHELLSLLLADLGIHVHDHDSVGMHEAFKAELLKEARAGRQVIVVIDEAQNLSNSVLETVRLFSNFENPSKKLLQIVLSGQPQLAQKLNAPELQQLKQRISIVTKLTPLSAQETAMYIANRLQIAGYCGESPLFTADAVGMIAHHSRGIPRNINTYCFNAMSLAFAMGKARVEAEMVQEVAQDLDVHTVLAPQTVEEGVSREPIPVELPVLPAISVGDGGRKARPAAALHLWSAARLKRPEVPAAAPPMTFDILVAAQGDGGGIEKIRSAALRSCRHFWLAWGLFLHKTGSLAEQKRKAAGQTILRRRLELAAMWSQSACPWIAKASEASLSACKRTSQAGLLAVREFAVYIAQAALKAMLALIRAMIGLQVFIRSVLLPSIRRTSIMVRARVRALLLAMALLFIRVTKQIVDAALQRIEKAKEYSHDPTPEALLGKESPDSLLSVSCQAGGAKL